MVLESTSPLVLRSPVQGRPTIAWATAYHKEAEKWERRARKKAEKAEAGGGQLYVTGRIKDMMIVRGKNYFPNDIEKSLRRDLPILRGGGLSCSKMRRTLSIASWRRRLRLAVARVFQVLLGTVMMRLAAYSGPESRVAWRKATARQA